MGRFCSFSRARLVALAMGAGVLGSLALAPASMAATQEPIAGANCQADGKISGAGSTFQANGINNAFTYGYQRDVCGTQSTASGLFQGGSSTGPDGAGGTITQSLPTWGTTDPSNFTFPNSSGGNTPVEGMVAYNYSLNGTSATSGSGAGLNRLSCRVDQFAGTDLPYNTTQFTAMRSAPGDITAGTNAPWNATPFKCGTFADHSYMDGTTAFSGPLNTDLVPPPYGAAGEATGTWPATGDTTNVPMSFPIAGGAVAFVANLNGVCTTTPPSTQTLNLTPTEFDDIWQGTINQWNDPTLDTNNTFLSTDGCSGNIQRVVRQDNSGTTAITMFTLNAYDQGTLCKAGSNGTLQGWYADAIASSNVGFWPEGCTAPGTSTTAPNEIHATGSGSPALIALTTSTPGAIGYAETGLWSSPNPLPAGNIFADLATPATQNNATPTFIGPGAAGAQSNCSFPTNVPTGTTAAAAVGLAATNWTNTGTATAPGKQDVADPSGGTGYPACGLTFDLVYTNQTESHELAAPAGGSATATAGCTIPAAQVPANVTTAVDNPSGSTTLIVPNNSVAHYPPSGTITANGVTLTYTSILVTGTAPSQVTSLKLSAATGTDTPSGSTISFVSTTAAATASAPGLTGQCLTTADSVSGLTNDQLRTLYSYFSYMLSPLGQNISTQGGTNTNLQAQTLDPLPTGWLSLLEQGFQNNF